MSETNKVPNPPTFRWYPKHLNHIAENIVFKNRNVSFLAINALFRQRKTHNIVESEMGNGHFLIEDYVSLQPNDRLRTHAERLSAVFYLDNHDNIVVITAFSENDTYDE